MIGPIQSLWLIRQTKAEREHTRRSGINTRGRQNGGKAQAESSEKTGSAVGGTICTATGCKRSLREGNSIINGTPC